MHVWRSLYLGRHLKAMREISLNSFFIVFDRECGVDENALVGLCGLMSYFFFFFCLRVIKKIKVQYSLEKWGIAKSEKFLKSFLLISPTFFDLSYGGLQSLLFVYCKCHALSGKKYNKSYLKLHCWNLSLIH